MLRAKAQRYKGAKSTYSGFAAYHLCMKINYRKLIILNSQQSFFRLVHHTFKFGMYLLYRLPAAFFSGVRVREIDEEKCITSVPYKWLTQNPFRSTYFASLAMAAEMSTGTLALSNVYKRTPAVSMLLVNMQANYFKKATASILFTCEDGKNITATVDEAIKTGEGKSITAKSVGRNNQGEVVAGISFYMVI